jgi:hypothetical protein
MARLPVATEVSSGYVLRHLSLESLSLQVYRKKGLQLGMVQTTSGKVDRLFSGGICASGSTQADVTLYFMEILH